MTLKPLSRRALLRRGSAILLLAPLLFAFVVLLESTRDIRTQVDDLATAHSDNLGWNISQADVDFHGFKIELLKYLIEEPENGVQITSNELDQIRIAFDIFYSRISVVNATLHRVDVPIELAECMNEIIDARAILADKIDAIREPSASSIQELLVLAQDLGPKIRLLTTEGIQVVSGLQTEARNDQYEIVSHFQTRIFVLFFLVIVACLIVIRLWRDLDEQSQRLDLAATNVTNAVAAALSSVIFLDPKGQIIQCNQAAETLFRSAVLVGLDFADTFIDPKYLKMFLAYQKAKARPTIRLWARHCDDRTFPIEMSGSWQKDVEGDDIYIVYLLDISARLDAEERLKTSRDEAKKASEAKSHFLAMMSHEMRTPLHGLIASLDMIQTKNLGEADQRLFRTARVSSDRALEQVNGVLAYTRITQTNAKEYAFTPSLAIRDIRDALTPLAIANGNTIGFEMLGDGVDVRFNGLPDSFSRVMYNLIGNAIKFTMDGSIMIEMIATQGKTPNSRCLNFIVKDTGIGIAQEDQDRIFERFETATEDSDDAREGSGLGLAIAKFSVAQMNSKIDLRSTLGKGSRFSFSVELEMAAGAAEVPGDALLHTDIPHKPVDPDGVVLIVDDNWVNCMVLEEMVSRLGYVTQYVDSGQDAVDAAQNTQFALILMDVNMSGLNGHDATRNIRDSGGKSAQTTIFGVTAQIAKDHFASTQSGMNAMLAKPLTTDRLTSAMMHYLPTANRLKHSDLETAFDPETARKLKRQSLADAQEGLRVITDDQTSWEERINALHYAVGSTAVIGFHELSQILSKAEDAAKQEDVTLLGQYADELHRTIYG
jgi:signal transduction histidine kinase/CheY-like chemotaxis protein/HPt (histidine-containing phosphotransfer) domain-containing protein